jgi:sirohydrochlorin cobaltochelatase
MICLKADHQKGTSEESVRHIFPVEKVLLVVSFGTSFKQGRIQGTAAIEEALGRAFPNHQIRRAFTSRTIINLLKKRDRLIIDGVQEAMQRLVLDQVKEVVVQSATILAGSEYDGMIETVRPFVRKFEHLRIGKPLLSDDFDYETVVDIIARQTAPFRAADTAVVCVGHGTGHAINTAYTKLRTVLKQKHFDDYIIGTLRSEPGLAEVRIRLKKMNIKKIILCPLMLVAGGHVYNDIAGGREGSWEAVLTNDGYSVETIRKGLGEISGIQELFIKHVKDAGELPERCAGGGIK